MAGESGNDQYQYAGFGNQVINEGVTPAGVARNNAFYDTDILFITNSSWTGSQIQLMQDVNDLVLATAVDVADGLLENSVTIQNFYLGGHYTVERLWYGAGQEFDLTILLGTMSSPMESAFASESSSF